MSKKSPSNSNNTNNYLKSAKEFIPDSEDADITAIEIVQKSKKPHKKAKTKKKNIDNEEENNEKRSKEEKKDESKKEKSNKTLFILSGSFAFSLNIS